MPAPGFPSWGPELLARTHYALGSGASTINTLPDLYAQWERWAADVAESHTTYLPLVRFRSPRPLSSWVTALLAVLDSAALYLALSPQSAPAVPARLCLRAGFQCLTQVAKAMGIDVPEVARPECRDQPQLRGVPRRGRPDAKVDFPIERDPLTPGRTSSAGGSTTSRPPTRWPPPSMPFRRCGRVREGTGSLPSPPSARRPDGRPSNPRRGGGITSATAARLRSYTAPFDAT